MGGWERSGVFRSLQPVCTRRAPAKTVEEEGNGVHNEETEFTTKERSQRRRTKKNRFRLALGVKTRLDQSQGSSAARRPLCCSPIQCDFVHRSRRGFMRTPAGIVLVAGVMLVISLGAQTPPAPPAGGGRGARRRRRAFRRHRAAVAEAAGRRDRPTSRSWTSPLAERGKEVWIAECITCHGAQARGTDTRSEPSAIGRHASRSLRQRDRSLSEEGTPDAERQALRRA